MPTPPEMTLRAFAAAARQSLVGQAARLRSHPQGAELAVLLQRHAHEPVGAVLQDELRALERAGGAASPSAPAEPVDYFLRRRALASVVTR